MNITCCGRLIKLVDDKATCPVCGTTWIVRFEYAAGLPVGFKVDKQAYDKGESAKKDTPA